MDTAYLLLLITSHVIGPVVPRDTPIAAATVAASVTLAQQSDAWILDSDLTLDDCKNAMRHLPQHDRPLWLATSATDTSAPFVEFDCCPADQNLPCVESVE